MPLTRPSGISVPLASAASEQPRPNATSPDPAHEELNRGMLIYATVIWSLPLQAPHQPSDLNHHTSSIYSALPSPILRTHLSRTQWTRQIQSPSDTQPSRYDMYWAASLFSFIHSARWFSHRVLLVLFAAMPWLLILSRMLRYYRDYYSYWFLLLYCSVNF